MLAAIESEDADAKTAGYFIVRQGFLNGEQYGTTLKKDYIHTGLSFKETFSPKNGVWHRRRKRAGAFWKG